MTSFNKIVCSGCDNQVDTPEEISSYPEGNCPECGDPWTGDESKHASVMATMPVSAGGDTLAS
jgi:predicted RNA-binding Zn-ribbon protein involved in translation (DUF1610 family)|tara:strand:+ start:2798 stop:2986 length:189 start_codon:yes stop_codon:yes gene_type:complete